MYPESYFLLSTLLHMKHLNSNKTHFPWFDKIAEVYGESNERQLCLEIAVLYLMYRIYRYPNCGTFYGLCRPIKREKHRTHKNGLSHNKFEKPSYPVNNFGHSSSERRIYTCIGLI